MEAEKKKINPYDWINPVHDRNKFAGRTEEINIVLDELQKVGTSETVSPIVTLVGNRRVGKTSILLRIKERCREISLLPILINIDNRLSSSIYEFWK